MQGQQEQHEQYSYGGDDQLRAGGPVLVVNVVSGSATRRAASLGDRISAVRANQVFAAHRNPFRLARAPALAAL
ncbi:MAG: hypothetical protein WAK82_32850 [Streptosporangiaceae bacterium]